MTVPPALYCTALIIAESNGSQTATSSVPFSASIGRTKCWNATLVVTRLRASLEGFNSAGSTNRNSIALARRSRNVSSVSPFSRAKKPSNGSSEPFSAAVRHSFVHSLNSPGEAKSASAKICFMDVSAIPRVADEER